MLNSETQKNVDFWLNGDFPDEIKQSVRQLIQDDPKQIEDAFSTHLHFGTGGLRGLMGIGTNRMNQYTVRSAAQGLVNYLRKQPVDNLKSGIVIGYDNRRRSREFAEETAKVIAGNGLPALLFKEMRPTPLISYACRHQNCLAAVMITASHNPPAYNGFKVYWSDGGQIVPPHDQGIMHEVSSIKDLSLIPIAPNLDHPLIQIIDTEIDEAYLTDISTLSLYPQVNQGQGHRLKVVYTSLHGTGMTLIPNALKRWGFSQIEYVEKQIIPDGSFPTVRSPNPEDRESLKMGIEQMLATQSDLLIATDPDADRAGVAVLHQGQAVILSGHQMAVICLEHICEALVKQNRMPERAAFIKTIGMTELFQAICDNYACTCVQILNGFKYIAEKIHQWEQTLLGPQFVFGCEESLGYLLGSFVRDKDAVAASALISEIALQAKLQGKTLVDKLHDLFDKYGIYEERMVALDFGETREGKEQIAQIMERLRSSRIEQIAGIAVKSVEDYQASRKIDLLTGQTEELKMPKSNVLRYWLMDGSKVMVRPSGTEPKIKISCGVVDQSHSESIEAGIAVCVSKCEAILKDMMRFEQIT